MEPSVGDIHFVKNDQFLLIRPELDGGELFGPGREAYIGEILVRSTNSDNSRPEIVIDLRRLAANTRYRARAGSLFGDVNIIDSVGRLAGQMHSTRGRAAFEISDEILAGMTGRLSEAFAS
ncbi:MAG TPA: hypothetical protein VLE99_04870 [Candidatus Saccharimonadales bacterium]|nr:hypothetical protein [Candidatus Saccharimonadales bacterium]